jgi:hypothetical protein
MSLDITEYQKKDITIPLFYKSQKNKKSRPWAKLKKGTLLSFYGQFIVMREPLAFSFQWISTNFCSILYVKN